MNKSRALLVGGLALIATAQLFAHFHSISDLYRGLAMGAGFGLMIVSMFSFKRNRVNT